MFEKKVYKLVEYFQKENRIPHDAVYKLRSRLSSLSDESFQNLLLSQILGDIENSEFEAYFSLGYDGLRRSFSPYEHILLHPNSKFAYIYIPKNACTTMKLAMMESIRPHILEEINNFPGNIHTVAKEELRISTCALPKDLTTLVIMRDPVSRFWSAFLDKLVRNSKSNLPMINYFMRQMSKADIISKEASFDNVKIGDILEYLYSAGDHLLDKHFASQSSFIPSKLSTLKIKIEHLNYFTSFIANLIGQPPKFKSSPHANSYNVEHDIIMTEDVTISEIVDLVKIKKTIPPSSALAESIKTKLNIRFQDDLKLYEKSF
jgi:hypothetical protein